MELLWRGLAHDHSTGPRNDHVRAFPAWVPVLSPLARRSPLHTAGWKSDAEDREMAGSRAESAGGEEILWRCGSGPYHDKRPYRRDGRDEPQRPDRQPDDGFVCPTGCPAGLLRDYREQDIHRRDRRTTSESGRSAGAVLRRHGGARDTGKASSASYRSRLTVQC